MSRWSRPDRRLAIALACAAAIVASARLAGVRLAPLLDPTNHTAVRDFVAGLYPPAHTPAFLAVAAAAALRTIEIAVAGTALALAIAVPLAALATATLFRRGPLVEGAPHRGLAAASLAARGVLSVVRAVPDLVWALFFVVGVGLGPAAGVLALAVSYGGTLGRVLADLFETVDPRPLEALHATGASRLQILVFGILPQALPATVAYTLYSFECCVRAAIVLGLVGAGGIGYEIALSMRMFDYGQIATLLVALLALVWLTDAASRGLRWALRGGSRRLAVAVTLVLAVACAAAVGLFDPASYDAGMVARMARFAGGFAPPDVAPAYLASLLAPLVQTLAISVIGTVLGVAIAGVLAIPAAAPHAEDDPTHVIRRGLGALCRGALSLLRAIPEVIWVLLFLLAVGVGPFAGTLALGVHTGGVLGKLYADTLEEVSPLPLRGLRATGASSLQLLVWGAWPEARRMLVSYTLLRWETNLRNSTIVGIAGGGGIGMALYNDVQLGFYPRVATSIVVIAAVVIAAGALGDALLRRLESASLARRPH